MSLDIRQSEKYFWLFLQFFMRIFVFLQYQNSFHFFFSMILVLLIKIYFHQKTNENYFNFQTILIQNTIFIVY